MDRGTKLVFIVEHDSGVSNEVGGGCGGAATSGGMVRAAKRSERSMPWGIRQGRISARDAEAGVGQGTRETKNRAALEWRARNMGTGGQIPFNPCAWEGSRVTTDARAWRGRRSRGAAAGSE